jgi:L-arabinose isomerase
VREVEKKLQRPGVEVVNLGLIDNAAKALQAGHQLRQADVDLVFLHVTTYALSATVLPVAQRAKVPVIILNLAPEAAIDYASFNKMGDRTAMRWRSREWIRLCSRKQSQRVGSDCFLSKESAARWGRPRMEIPLPCLDNLRLLR